MTTKSIDTATVKVVQLSYGRCLSDGNVIQTFYDKFLAADPDVKKQFVNTDFQKQYNLLKHGINLMIMFASANFVGETGLKRIQHTHNRQNMNIDPRFYPLWKKSLIEAVKVHDKKFDRTVEKAWEDVLQKGISFIVEGY